MKFVLPTISGCLACGCAVYPGRCGIVWLKSCIRVRSGLPDIDFRNCFDPNRISGSKQFCFYFVHLPPVHGNSLLFADSNAFCHKKEEWLELIYAAERINSNPKHWNHGMVALYQHKRYNSNCCYVMKQPEILSV